MSDSRPILNVWGAELSHGARKILRGVDLTLRPGEIYALLGPNGAGKTTLIHAICGRMKLSKGDIALEGQNPWSTPVCRAALGLVPQNIALYNHMTVAENLQTFGRLAGVRGRALRDAVARAIHLCRIADRENEPIGRLSGGYRRRVNIACAILHGPRLLILDEPMVGVDPDAREALDGVIRDLRDAGVCVLMITHDLDQAGDLADRVGFLREGRKVMEGSPRGLITQAFGEELEILVQLDEDPDSNDEIVLNAAGLERRGKTNVWTTLDAGGYATAGRLDSTLRRAGVTPREIRVRQPSLHNLFTLVADWQDAA
ncbi:MAG: ABC transporter ATP-binding protein [Caulobacteraceae bacterium]|nr:MAG: ABC transporter ATP-binding protein [Caulobacteraceae bacterium]